MSSPLHRTTCRLAAATGRAPRRRRPGHGGPARSPRLRRGLLHQPDLEIALDDELPQPAPPDPAGDPSLPLHELIARRQRSLRPVAVLGSDEDLPVPAGLQHLRETPASSRSVLSGRGCHARQRPGASITTTDDPCACRPRASQDVIEPVSTPTITSPSRQRDSFCAIMSGARRTRPAGAPPPRRPASGSRCARGSRPDRQKRPSPLSPRGVPERASRLSRASGSRVTYGMDSIGPWRVRPIRGRPPSVEASQRCSPWSDAAGRIGGSRPWAPCGRGAGGPAAHGSRRRTRRTGGKTAPFSKTVWLLG